MNSSSARKNVFETPQFRLKLWMMFGALLVITVVTTWRPSSPARSSSALARVTPRRSIDAENRVITHTVLRPDEFLLADNRGVPVDNADPDDFFSGGTPRRENSTNRSSSNFSDSPAQPRSSSTNSKFRLSNAANDPDEFNGPAGATESGSVGNARDAIENDVRSRRSASDARSFDSRGGIHIDDPRDVRGSKPSTAAVDPTRSRDGRSLSHGSNANPSDDWDDGRATPRNRRPSRSEETDDRSVRRGAYSSSVDDLRRGPRSGAAENVGAWLDHIRDNTLGVLKDEAPSLFRLLAYCRSLTDDDLAANARDDVQYAHLMNDPELLRGELISIVGTMRRFNEFPAARNEYGVDRMFEGWVFAPDSGSHPLRVVCVDPGAQGLMSAESLPSNVRVAGYFFKLEGYAAQSGLQLAPVLVARSIQPYRLPNAPPSDPAGPAMLFGGIVGAGLLFGGLLIFLNSVDRRASPLPERRLPSYQQERESLAMLQRSETESVESGLSRLEQDYAIQSRVVDTGELDGPVVYAPPATMQESSISTTTTAERRPGPIRTTLAGWMQRDRSSSESTAAGSTASTSSVGTSSWLVTPPPIPTSGPASSLSQMARRDAELHGPELRDDRLSPPPLHPGRLP